MKRLFIFFTTLFMAFSTYAQDDEPTTFRLTDGIVSNEVRTFMENNLFEMFKSFQIAVVNGTTPNLPKKGFTADARKDISMLWDCSEFICPNLEVEETLLKNGSNWEIRNVPVIMLAYEKDSEKELVIGFDPRGNISGIDIAVGTKVYNRIMAEGSDQIDMARRQTIVNFIEIFRTAYNKKDLKYLEQVYSDDALIITGRVVKTKPKSNQELLKDYGEEKIEYVRHDKQSYIDNLRRAFTRSRFINVKFSDLDVKQHPKHPEVYGVTLRQDWSTQGYHDDGFVFLLIDFKDENNPQIHVRTWQPAVKNGRELPKEEIFGIGSFNI